MPTTTSSLFRSRRERFHWTVATVLVVVTWATLYWARPLAEWFRDRGWITELMYLIFAASALAVLAAVLRLRPGWKEMAVLGVFGLIYFFQIRRVMGQPEEALHFVQYGAVGGFFYAALSERARHTGKWGAFRPALYALWGAFRPTLHASRDAFRPALYALWRAFRRALYALWGAFRPAFYAFLLTTAAGWIDEGIQYFLPNRYYDLRDVGFNATAGFLAIAAVGCLRWVRGTVDEAPGGAVESLESAEADRVAAD